MKIREKKIVRESDSSAYQAGSGLREIIIRDGLNDSIVKHLRIIFRNHSDNELKNFILGLSGLDENGKPPGPE